ncbi:glycosyltransferase family 2 protein [Kitasatospora cineracea]|uniref:Glycosyl transferase family 2 n=1 Tax=Kitasatospora cineracea TaxID=88074 RepID=A0A3N4S1H6_9ACTN|nr:glycosyltransferase family A protein [Kitasatospora cineracea]ROR44239.1 glycosyl transferase family 2 [Kitasatospora cineracea]RPE34587.1 glycosyl transferase family 2 [Kitasatospora cineracea]
MTEQGPDVSVVIAVHDTMPYLTACLDSLVGQSIERQRMEVVAVDDGSSDGSSEELARYAAAHPGLFRTARQPASGGPASPTNRGTDLARGRYLLYLGSDDWLGPEALERMVAAADRWQSDVLIPKQVGEHGRVVPQGIFDRTAEQVGFTDSALAWALGDTKLFRRDLVTSHGLRRREDLVIHSDQPFTLGALLHARKVSVLADYDYYHLVLRRDRSNVTHRAGPLDRLRGFTAAHEVLDRGTLPGPARDAVRARYFSWDVPQLLQAPFLAEPPAMQRRIVQEIGRFTERHCSPAVFRTLPVPARLRLALARRGELLALCDLITWERDHGEAPAVRRGSRLYAGYPVFRDRHLGLPDALFELGRAPGPAGWRRLVPAPLRRARWAAKRLLRRTRRHGLAAALRGAAR